MPKIVVNEKDLSWYYRPREPRALTVYVPGLATFGPDYPVLCDDINFKQVFGSEGVAGLADDFSYQSAASYLKAGFNVLFQRIIPKSATYASSDRATITFETPISDDEDLVLTNASGVVEGRPTDFSVTIPGGSTEVVYNDLEYAADVIALLDQEGVAYTAAFEDAAHDSTDGVRTFPSSYVTVRAKYPGSFGNKLKVEFRGTTDNSQRVMYLYLNDSLVEQTVIEFTDYSTDRYYETVSRNSAYVEILLNGEFSNDFLIGETVQLSGGVDYEGSASDLYVEVVEKIGSEGFFDDLKDPYSYSFDVLTSGGFSGCTDSTYTELSKVDLALVDVAKSRGTSIYLVDGHKDWTDAEYYEYCGLFNTSYAAAFGPWHYAQLLSNGRTQLLPGNYIFLITWGQSCVNNPTWLAPAGVKRAAVQIPVSPVYPVGKSVLAKWQESRETTSYQVNPIVRLKQYGYVIYGNSTLLRSRADGYTSMLQSFSTRVLANLIKNHAFDVSLNLQFDQLTDNLFVQFKTLMGVFMDQLKYQGALYDYKIVVDRESMTLTDLNTRTVPVRIMISPNPAAENFIIDLEIAQAGVTFTDDTDETAVN